MSLPQFQDNNRNFQLLQTQWASQLDPVIANPLVQGRLIKDVALITGSTTINHRLGRKLQGYMVVLQSASASIYDSQATNTMSDKTLVLVSDTPVTVSLWVF